ncbi:MAG: hypothetical protein WD225_05345 [Ilumatobacteraceae bacterium]
MARRTTETTITRDDLESKFQGLQDQLQGKVDEKKRTLAGTAAGVGVVFLLIMFLLGRRSGKKKRTVVEIRRL